MSTEIYCQYTGLKYLKNYSRQEYGQHPQNWSILQDKRGIIYVGNNGCVLEFDGTAWRSIAIKDNGPVRSLAIDETGTIFIGSINEIGFLAPDSNGSLGYRSLREHLNDEKISFSAVKRTHSTPQGIYFQAKEFLFRWHKGGFRKWTPQYQFDSSFVQYGTLFIRDGKRGLLQLVGDELNPVTGGDNFAEAEIFMMAPYDNHRQKLFMATRSKGCFLYDGKAAYPFPTQVDGYLKEKKVCHGIRLSSGDYALATLAGGLVIIDARGRLKQIFDKKTGLQDDNVKYVFEDFQGNLWLGLDYGIAKIEYHSPFSLYDERVDLPKMVLSMARHQQALYVGTKMGLWRMAPTGEKFQKFPGIDSNCWCLLSTGDTLLAATSDGVFQVDTHGKRKITAGKTYVLHPSGSDKRRIWAGTDKGVTSLRRKDLRWAEEFAIEKNINREIRTIVEDGKGNLWLGANAGVAFKLNFPSYIKEPVINRFGESHGLPPSEIRVFGAAGNVVFATQRGILRFDEPSGRFMPDYTLGNQFREVFYIAEDQHQNIWLHSKSRTYHFIHQPDDTYRVNEIPFLKLPRVQVNAIFFDDDAVWLGSHDNLIRFDTGYPKNYRQNFQALIRRVVVNGKTIIYAGNHRPKGDGREPLASVLPYKERNLRFECAAPFFENETSTMYRYLLEGYDKDWSDWSAKTQENYTNLDAGEYTFRVQAQNVYRHKSREAIYQFKILTPWYQTWWAFLMYIFLSLMLLYITVRWRSRKLQLEKQRLEQTVAQRTQEINLTNLQLGKQALRLQEQSEKLQEMAAVKSRFFANISHEFRTPLTLIMGPLEKMLSQGHPQTETKELRMMLRNSQRLLTLINQLLDLSKLDSGKMKLNADRQNIIPFLKGILASFESLALQNHIDLTFRSDTEDITLYFDTQKLEAVICNLLINAVKFTPAGGMVTVSVHREEDKGSGFSHGCLELSVRDTGPGIPREKLPHIFDRFFQSQETGKGAHQGTGIGLALAKELVLLHRGQIDVHVVHSSKGESSGTEFIIRLPLGDEHLSPGEKAAPGYRPSPGQYFIKEAEENDIAETKVEIGEDEVNKAEETDTQPIVLVVEDNPDVRAYIKDSLEPRYRVVEANDGREGIRRAKEIIPDLIISDIMMPEVDGYELCRVLKQEIKTSHIPIIMLTAKASEESVVEGLETGADDYITKPFNTRILMTRIKNLIELRRQLQEKIQRQMLLQPVEIAVSSIDQKFIQELQEIIEKNLSDPDFNVEALSKKLYMNRATIYRKIMALTGESPTQFIRSYRLKRAAQLLRAKFGNVTEVALEVGFSNMAYFARCFKDKFHQLPSTYQTAESQ